MKRILILVISSFIITGFSSCPLSNNEPLVTPCGLFPPRTIDGPHYFVCKKDGDTPFELSMVDAMKFGFKGLTIPDYAEVVKHHQKLHVEVDLCE